MKTVRLGDVSELVKGRKPARFTSGGNIYLTARSIRKLESPKFVSQNDKNSVLVKPNDLIIIMDGSNSGELFTGLSGVLASTMGLIRHQTSLDSRYLLYFLITHRENFSANRTGSAIPHLNKDQFINLKISLPSVEEQRRIVARLDAAFEKIDRAIQLTGINVNNVRYLYRQTSTDLFNSMAGKDCILSDVCSIESKLIDPKKDIYKNLLHIGGANIQSETGGLVSLKTAEQEKLISSKFLFDENTVLYSKIRPYLKKVARPSFTGLCSADIYPLTTNSQLSKDFLYYLLLSDDFTRYAISGSERAGMPKVNRPHLFSYRFKLPSMSDQEVITKRLDDLSLKTEELAENYRVKISSLNDLKQSMLTQAFFQDKVQ